MTGWPVRLLLNTVYAFLAEQADAADRVAEPTLLAAGVKGDEVAEMSRRAALDEWLDAPSGQTAAEEQALVRYLTA